MNEKGNKYALAALKEKRAALSGEIVQLKRQIRSRKDALVHVDATLQILDPSIDLDSIPSKRPKHVNLFRSGELSTLVLSAFRRANGEAITSKQITDSIVEMDGFGEDARQAIVTRVRSNLAYQEKRGKLIKSGVGTDALWRLVQDSL